MKIEKNVLIIIYSIKSIDFYKSPFVPESECVQKPRPCLYLLPLGVLPPPDNLAAEAPPQGPPLPAHPRK